MRILYLCMLLGLIAVATLIYGSRLTSTTENQFPPIGNFIQIDGTRLHYSDTGNPDEDSDPTILVLLHGASTSLLDFEPSLVPALSPSYRVISFDRPGLGYSERGDQWFNPAEQARLIQLGLQQMGVTQSIWIGHSWAGSVVLAALLDNPLTVKAGLLLAGATHPWDTGVSWHVALTNQAVIGDLFSRLIVPIVGAAALEGAVDSVFIPETMPPDYIQNTGVMLSLRPHTFRNNAEDVYHLSDWLQQQSPRYEQLSQPLLLITGTADTVVPSWNHAERLAEILPAAQWQSLEGAGHALHHSRTEEVTNHIVEFVTKLHNQP